jgi:DNA-binding CsgD family transcriptional regulator
VPDHSIADSSLSAGELALAADVLETVGTPAFYERVLVLLDERIQCERRLVMKYSRFARPEVVFNTSLEADAVSVYLSSLYRLDPLLRLVAKDEVRPVVTYREIRLVDHENAFYDEIFRAGMVLDELAIMLPTLGGAYVGLCFDRDDSYFGPHEVHWATLLYPLLRRAHELHVRTAMLSGLNSLFGEGRVGILTLADDAKVVYRNDSWKRVVAGLDEAAVIAHTLERPERSALEVDNRVAHWEFLASRDAPVNAYRTLFLEERGAGYIDRDIKGVLAGFIAAYQLSPRESQILEKMMRGHPTGSISSKLGLSPGTVKNYKRRLYDKLDITNEREVFPLFIEHLFGAAEAAPEPAPDDVARHAAPRLPAGLG